jgi:hypothetical protein
MNRRNSSLISIASEETLSFLMRSADGGFKTVASMPLEAFLSGGIEAGELPRAALQSAHRLLVVPDYWVGNNFYEFQARNKSVVAAFIERKLKLEQPALTEAADFYNYAIVQGRDRRQQLYAFYLQEAVAYRLYRRMEQLGISPLQITTPALVWQAKLGDLVDGFGEKGVGFIHLGETDCFLYFYFMGQFLFSRPIDIPDTGGDASQTYNLLNYEINQSFYLYSQKTKSSVDALFLMAPDPEGINQLAELLGREVLGVPQPPPYSGLPVEPETVSPCRGFTAQDLEKRGRPFIAYKPLHKELSWRPVQWAGIAVGIFLTALLVVESGYLYLKSGESGRQMRQLISTAAEPPEMVLQNLSTALNEVTLDLARPSAGTTIMRTLLAMPEGVSLKRISLNASGSPHLDMEAVVDGDHPDAFKATLTVFLDQLNQQFNLQDHPLREKDVTIHLDRGERGDSPPVYRINFGFEMS